MQFLQGFCLVVGNERQNNLIQGTGQYLIQLIHGQVDPVISHPTLRKIIGSNSLTAISAADLTFTIFGDLVMTLLLKLVKQAGSHDLQGLCLILVL